jgi:hypothetical protein
MVYCTSFCHFYAHVDSWNVCKYIVTDCVDICTSFLLPDACVCTRALQIVSALFICRVLVSGRWLRLVSIVHHILIVWPGLLVILSFSVLEAIERWTSASLAVCTKDEQRGVIRFLWAEGVKSAEIHSCLCAQYRTVHCHAKAYISGYSRMFLQV